MGEACSRVSLPPVRLLIAPDKFKGSLTAAEAARAIAEGAQRAASEAGIDIQIDECPVADGGEGLIDALAGGLGATRPVTSVHGPAGQQVSAEWASFESAVGLRRDRRARPAGYGFFRMPRSIWFHPLWSFFISAQWHSYRAALIESAAAVGLHLTHSPGRDPSLASTRGLGELIRSALDHECSQVCVGLGGSATVDGGIGAAAALGARFPDESGDAVPPIGDSLARITAVDLDGIDRHLRRVELVALCDVSNPLLGPRGAARVFGPQKGATPEQVERLEAGLENLVRVCREAGLPCDPDAPGAGAAGGLGFGLATFLGAELRPGAPFILDLVKFRDRAARADLVITGEGRMDAQTAGGKAAAAVAIAAAELGKPVIAIVGTTDRAPDELVYFLNDHGVPIEEIHPLVAPGKNPERAMRDAVQQLEQSSHRVVKAWLEGTAGASG